MARSRWIRLGVLAAVLLTAPAGAWVAVTRLLPAEGLVAEGVLLSGARADGKTPAGQLALEHVEALLARRVRLLDGDEIVLDADLRELGATVDVEHIVRALGAVGRRGSLLERLDEAWSARRGRVMLVSIVRLPLEPLAKKLDAYKEQRDRAPIGARWDFALGAAGAHRDGSLIDVPAAAEVILASALGSAENTRAESATLPRATVVPSATTNAVARASFDDEMARYATRFAFGGSQAGRAQNIERAASRLHGLVMMPGDVVSFNELVGPRSADNGFAQAGEIYKGEMRMGIGGGSCQVASTLHAAAYLGGLDVVVRSPHSRPSGYIGLGLDATVAYPHVDLKLKNPFPFAIAVHASVEQGVLTLALYGQRRLAKVSFAALTKGVRPYERKVHEAAWLPEGRVIHKQKGIRGITVEKTRLIVYSDGRSRVDTSTDVYPPTNEVFYVAPGTDVESALPPLPEAAGDAAG